MQRMMKIAYEGIMILFIMLTITTIWTENTYNSTINWIVWGVFFIDFFIRLFSSKEKWNFLKQNPFLLIAIIPFDQFFQVARIVRVIYFFRIKTIAKYYIFPYIEKLTYKSIMVLISIILILLLAGSVVVWNVESSIPNYFEALYVLFGHLLFFGHQLFVIKHPISMWILTGTSIVGIVLQGLALQWAFNKVEMYFKSKKQKEAISREG